MQIIVQKYGGTSVANIERIKWVANNIIDSLHKDNRNKLVVVVSAMSGETDRLFSLASEITRNRCDREIDNLVSTGEQVSVSLLTMALKSKGIVAKSLCGWQIPIVTTDNYTQARIKKIDAYKLLFELEQNQVIIVAGFQGVTEFGDVTTLGRGGSDTSAVAVAVSLNAIECQIFTDVNGVYSADPNKVTTAKRIDKISGDIMFEMASLGAKVLHVRSCELAYRYKLNIRVLSTFAPQDQGSLVVNTHELENYPIISLASEEQQTLFSIDVTLASEKINIIIATLYDICNLDMLSMQNCDKGVFFSVNYANCSSVIELLNTNGIKYSTINNLTKLSLVGSGFRSNNGLNASVWKMLDGFEVFAVTHNELSMSILVHCYDVVQIRNKFAYLL